jgi:hypothetical protein
MSVEDVFKDLVESMHQVFREKNKEASDEHISYVVEMTFIQLAHEAVAQHFPTHGHSQISLGYHYTRVLSELNPNFKTLGELRWYPWLLNPEFKKDFVRDPTSEHFKILHQILHNINVPPEVDTTEAAYIRKLQAIDEAQFITEVLKE